MPRFIADPPYPDLQIQKLEDLNHFAKKMYNRLDKRKKELKGQVIDGRKGIGGTGRITEGEFQFNICIKILLFSGHGQTEVVLLHGDYEEQDRFGEHASGSVGHLQAQGAISRVFQMIHNNHFNFRLRQTLILITSGVIHRSVDI